VFLDSLGGHLHLSLSWATVGLAGKEVLVPLTQSLYVPGTIGSSKEVLVDVGTGFYVGKPLPAAADLMKKRAEQVSTEVNNLQKVVAIKQSNLEVLTSAIEQRIAIAERMKKEAEAGGAAGR
jgi:prefoldin alpha subunit